MKYTENGDTITITMSWQDYDELIFLLGLATAAAEPDSAVFWRRIDFVNRMNDGNPRWTPYAVPRVFQDANRP